MKPTSFSGGKLERWRPWARKTKAYCNAKRQGFRAAIEWAEQQVDEIHSLANCPWNQAADLDAAFKDFLATCLTGHAGLMADDPALKDRGFET